jgi:hypothetical protein
MPLSLDSLLSVRLNTIATLDAKDITPIQSQLRVFEGDFDKAQSSLRTIASAWILAAIGAVALIIQKRADRRQTPGRGNCQRAQAGGPVHCRARTGIPLVSRSARLSATIARSFLDRMSPRTGNRENTAGSILYLFAQSRRDAPSRLVLPGALHCASRGSWDKSSPQSMGVRGQHCCCYERPRPRRSSSTAVDVHFVRSRPCSLFHLAFCQLIPLAHFGYAVAN